MEKNRDLKSIKEEGGPRSQSGGEKESAEKVKGHCQKKSKIKLREKGRRMTRRS